MAELDMDDLTKTARALLDHERVKPPEADKAEKDDAQSLLSKALDVIAGLTNKRTRRAGSAGDAADKALQATEEEATKAVAEEEDVADDEKIYDDIMALLRESQAHLDKHDDDDDSGDLVKALKGEANPGAVAINGYLVKALTHQETLTARIGTLEAAVGNCMKALALVASGQNQTKQWQAQALVSQALMESIKALLNAPPGAVSKSQDGKVTTLAPSRFAAIEQHAATRLGPRGGQDIPYNQSRAADMMMKGQLSKEDHKTWKTLNRLPDHVQLSA